MITGIVVQARNSSTRYPKKMTSTLAGRRAIEWVLDRCSVADTDVKILATSTDPSDDMLAEVAKKMSWMVVRGDLQNVLNRYVKAVEEFGLDVVVRITGDCILIDPRLIDMALKRFIEEGADYLVVTGIIDGFDVQVISSGAIIEAARHARLPSEKEHVTPYIKDSGKFRKVYLAYGGEDLSDIHLSLDYPEDAEVIGNILKELGSENFKYEDVVRLIKKKPGIIEKTRHIAVNYGMEVSRLEDRKFIESLKAKPLNVEKSVAFLDRALRVIPGASQTFSKSHIRFSVEVSPLFVRKAKGCIIEDLDGNSFIDYTMGLGPCLLGYSYQPVNEAVKRQLDDGVAYTLPHVVECEVAELLCELIPCAEMVRFGKNGSDVTSAAVRVARAFTGRDLIACCGYHGWQDWYIATTTRNKGIPESVARLTLTFGYNDIGSLEKLFAEHRGEIAAVIMEPVGVKEPDEGFLEGVKELTRAEGAVLIFDEVITGFRFSLGGAQEYFNVIPDLACFGKAMGNGMPISAIVGGREIMKLFDEVFYSFTFGGEAGSLVACKATIKEIRERDVIGFIWRQGEKLLSSINNLIGEKGAGDIIETKGYPVRNLFSFKGEDEAASLALMTLFQQECVRRGLLFTGVHNVSLPHTDEIIDRTLNIYSEAIDILIEAVKKDMVADLIEGRIVKPVFRKA